MKKFIAFMLIGIVLSMLSSCGGGSSNSNEEEGNTLTQEHNCSSVENSRSCYLNYITLSELDKQCCDSWITQQQQKGE